MLLFTDVDNTLIYSHRHMIQEPVIWVEELDGRPQSFISGKTYHFYEHQNGLEVVPITTRTFNQYLRLKDLFSYFRWKNVLICNGAILLSDGSEDADWTKESVLLSEKDRPFYEEAYEYASKIIDPGRIVAIHPFMFYIKAEDVGKTVSLLSERLDQKHITVLRDARKVYCFPVSLSKGTAAERYKQRVRRQHYIAAGDSEFDIPMLMKADICIYPDSLAQFDARGIRRPCRGLFSDEVCRELEQLREKGLFCD